MNCISSKPVKARATPSRAVSPRARVTGADFAKGSRFIQGGGSADITRFRRYGNKGLNTLVNILFSTKYTDLCYGYNAFCRHCLDSMRLPAVHAIGPQWGDGFEIETLINVRVAAKDLNIAEVCSCESQRIHGVSNLNAVTDGVRVLRTIRQEFAYSRAEKMRGRGGIRRVGVGVMTRANRRHHVVTVRPTLAVLTC